MTNIGEAEQEAIDRLQKFNENELRLALMFQAGLPVPGWRPTENHMAYSLEFGPETHRLVRLVVKPHVHYPGQWRWYVRDAESHSHVAVGGPCLLAWDAVVEGMRSLRELVPDAVPKNPDWRSGV